ncbi:hypothetical protein PHJA_001400900 [Phtheirospermum japonicum]|uniref:U5 small nuclear ribonucleoprotein TSSC4 n=1 Tax=Phtheirospermum japonicum TaxID=374723 RepID=A0A830BWU7_9LAMI|nr:hypothetical protein PHJA_001400900 [Phtheirospermum japonicum]
MEDSFRVRADKVFGSLGGDNTASSVGVSSSLWCLGDEEIERREWNRNKDVVEEEGDMGVESRPVVVPNPIESDLQDLSDFEEEEEEDEVDEGEIDGGKKKRRRNTITSVETSADEYFDVQSNIGRDCTLDYEEEEDQYDKVAVGTNQTGDRIFMRDVQFGDYDTLENEYCELPNTLRAVIRDPRANHAAAKIRLQEDAEAVGNFDNSAATNSKTEDLKRKELDCDNPKPILKKRENPMDSRSSQKRVSFVFDPESSSQAHEDRKISGDNDELASEPEHAPDLSLYSPGVPDYLMNPSKYTRYAFDASDDMDDQSNRKAHMEFFDQLRKRNIDSPMDEASFETPKSVVFMPRRKNEEGSIGKRSESEGKSKSWSFGLMAEDNGESEVFAMEEDEPCQAVDDEGRSSGRAGRRYRTRTSVDDNSN